MRTFLLFCLLSVCESAASPVVGVQGQNVTLKCTYNVKKNSYKPACWTRGPLPTFGCGETIVRTDGYIVTKESDRYRLWGRLQDGDVSLTILNVKKEDTAMYSCRVEIFGLFNDEKHTIKLIVEDASDSTSFKTSTLSDAIIRATYAPTTSLEGLQNSSSITTMTKNKQRSISKLIILLGVLFGLIFVLTVAVIVRIFVKMDWTSCTINGTETSARLDI
ncbi:T-cell immunoglobulin and mucin domain-containing protein 4-like isoform X2 [Corythoichthys intestinalis]|uniref:T-cell immunoglobulin and mucin domain-containing protein 4-like isoform X2 n=1 Tax=Corythoichthys intestinalis TaxID=161448 RepID=UPI0025A4F6C9|nr:T-cell immunoglobulin and mucin domain-containing protein 4-like isoform X2 [Corythoichthys intestinalis]